MADALDQNFTYLLPGLSIGFSGLSYNKRSMATCIRGQLSWILDSQLRDTAKASLMLPDGSYCRKHSAVPFDSQDTFMQQHPHIPAAAAGCAKGAGPLAEGLGQKAALDVKYFFACMSLSFYDGGRQC